MEQLNEKISNIITMCKNVYKALAHKIGIHYSTYEEVDYDEIDYYADRINQKYDYKEQDKSNDFEMHM